MMKLRNKNSVMWYFTRHASHVTRHTSHITRHASHVTRHNASPGQRWQLLQRPVPNHISVIHVLLEFLHVHADYVTISDCNCSYQRLHSLAVAGTVTTQIESHHLADCYKNALGEVHVSTSTLAATMSGMKLAVYNEPLRSHVRGSVS